MPFFSVIIPLYNKAHFIANTLKSVLAQSFPDFEVLVINDGSTDDGLEIAQGFHDQRIRYFNQENKGVSAARNLGIENASAKYVCFIDADDMWHADFLETIHYYIQKFPEQKVFASAIEIETSKKVFKPDYSIPKDEDFAIMDYFEGSVKESAICTSSVVIEKSVFEKSGVFDKDLRVLEDIDLWIRIGLNFKVLFVWKVLARYIYDEKSLSRNDSNYFQKGIYDRYGLEETQNAGLKKFLDLNRFSSAIKSKLIGDKPAFENYYRSIDLQNLSAKKRLLLLVPAFSLRVLVHLKTFLANIGLGNSVFK